MWREPDFWDQFGLPETPPCVLAAAAVYIVVLASLGLILVSVVVDAIRGE